MMLYKVTSVAFDPSTRTAFYTNQNYAYRDINAIDVDTGKKRRLLTDARIGDLAFDRADKSLWGIRHQNGFVTLVRIPPPYTAFNQIKTFHYGEVIFDLDVSPDGELISASYGSVDGKQSVKVWQPLRSRARGFRKSGRRPLASFRGAREFHFHAGRQGAPRQLLLYRRLQHLSVRHRERQMGCAQQCCDGLLPAAAAARRIATRL